MFGTSPSPADVDSLQIVVVARVAEVDIVVGVFDWTWTAELNGAGWLEGEASCSRQSEVLNGVLQSMACDGSQCSF